MKKLAAGLFATFCLFAQPQPQLLWEGEVDGTSIIHVRGNRLDIEDRSGSPVQRDRHRFYDALPPLRQRAQVQRIQGRGDVRITAQPDTGNNFTLSVMIEDRLPGRGFYSVAFYWEPSSRGGSTGAGPRHPVFDPRNSPSNRGNRGEERLTWAGQVDDEVIIECRGSECRSRTIRGQTPRADRFYFSRPLPNDEIRLSLDDVQGRGDVQLLEHPSAGNGYTATVRVRDTQSGYGDYNFSLFWTRVPRSQPDRLFARQGLVWSGRVDGQVRVEVRDSHAQAQVIAGGPVEGERASFTRPLPRELSQNAAVKKLRGRGRVDLVEFPSARNGWTLAFEVNDTSGGADNYEVEVVW